MPRRTTKTKTVHDVTNINVGDNKQLPANRVRNEQGKVVFAKGKSGNPAGRPKGSMNRTKILAEALLGDNAQKIVKKVIEQALDGDVACMKMCMDRIIPTQRSVDISGTVKQETGIQILVEGVTSFEKTHRVIEGEVEEIEFEEDDRNDNNEDLH